MILSGTASGVIGASFVAKICNLAECLSLDIGGTSADVALILNGVPQYGNGEYIGEHQIHVPSISVTSIGEGDGSVAWVDEYGVLKIEPESAGSTPGPACYGRGGVKPTITDAFAVCGIIGLVTRFGIDPRSTSMMPFGGAGPMMGCLLAREMGMSETVIPTTPGALSALGGLVAGFKNDFIRTVYADLTQEALPQVRSVFAELHAAGAAWLRTDQGYEGEGIFTYSADMRYRGQS